MSILKIRNVFGGAFLKMLKRIKYIIIFISLITVIIGLVRINIINTKALSPLGNSKENYEKIKESFGEEFSNFINDNALIKIYEDDSVDGILVRIGDSDYKIRKQSYIIDKLESVFDSIEDISNNFFEILTE